MKKKMYVTPAMEIVLIEACDMMAQSMGSDSLGMDFGGDASATGIMEADGNQNGGWDIW